MCSKSKQLLFLFFLLLFSVISICFCLLTQCPHCQRAIFLLSLNMYKTFLTVNNHQTMEVYQIVMLKPQMQEDNISETVDNVVLENQESRCNWQRIRASKDTAIVSRQCININKYNFIIHVIIICSYMLLYESGVCHCVGTISVKTSVSSDHHSVLVQYR